MIGMSAQTGRAISGSEHLAQSMIDVILTPLGTRTMRRSYGSLVPDLIDHPMNGANILRIYAATAHALMQWEPRVRVTGVALTIAMDGAATLDLDCLANGSELKVSVPVRSA